MVIDRIALILAIIGGLNWGSVELYYDPLRARETALENE